MHALTSQFIDHTTGRKTIIWLIIACILIASFAVYFVPVITAETGGLRPIDTQVPLTAEVIYRDLVNYTDKALSVYGWFLFVDCFYPATLATFIAYFWGMMLLYADKPGLTNIFRKGLVLLPFVGAGLDVCENIGLAIIINNYPEELWDTAYVVQTFRTAKLSVQIGDILITLGLMAMTALLWFRQRKG
ncbi:MAG: hypothetical protein ACR2QG_09730 [Gammaproteobacteria bacterium]